MKGSVIKRGNRYSVVVDLGRDEKGRRVRRWHSGFLTRQEAEEARVNILSQLQKGSYVSPRNTTVRDYLIQWLDGLPSSNLRASTIDSYRRNVKTHVLPRIGHLQLQKLTTSHVNALLADLLQTGRMDGNGGLGRRTVSYIRTILHSAFEDAITDNLVVHNVVENARRPQGREFHTTMRTYSADQVRHFLDSASSHFLFPAFLVAVTTGMRRGEICGLEWEAVDFENARLYVRQTLGVIRYRLNFESTTKTGRGRAIDLDYKTVATLRSHRARQLQEKLAFGGSFNQRELVFVAEDGSPLHPERLSKTFRRQAKAANLPVIRFQDLRHTHATLALKAGIPTKVVAERLGHASTVITENIYMHVTPGMQRDAAEQVANLIFSERRDAQ